MKSENYLKDIAHRLLACVVLVLFAFLGTAHCQLPLSPSPMPRLQFFDKSGKPLSGGKVFTYQAGTTTLQSTFVDASGSFFNTNPIILDSGGFGSIWLTSSSYKFVVQDRFGQAQWTADNVIATAGLTSLGNTWTLAQIFTQPIAVTPVNNQIVLGALGSQTTLDIPPPSSNMTLHFPNSFSDTLTANNTSQTLTNKFIVSPNTTGSDGGAETLLNKTITSPTITSPFLNGETVTNAARYFITCYKQAAAGGGGNSIDCNFVPDKAITVTRVIFGATLTAPLTCATSPHFGVFTTVGLVTVADTGPLLNTTTFVDSGPITAALSAGTSYAIGETANDAGCGTHAGPGNITVEYKMQ